MNLLIRWEIGRPADLPFIFNYIQASLNYSESCVTSEQTD
jgi:hypothetical protein